MQMRIKSALVVFAGAVVTFAVMFAFDYTDRYVSDRFHEAVRNAQPDSDKKFSLDAFMEYYDWDSVCLVLPETEHAFSTRFGRDYVPKASGADVWSLVLIKDKVVEAEILIERSFLDYPKDIDEYCFERWAAVFSLIREDDGRLRLCGCGL